MHQQVLNDLARILEILDLFFANRLIYLALSHIHTHQFNASLFRLCVCVCV